MAQLPRKSAKNAACRSPAWCRTVDIRAQSALGLAEGPTSKASPPHSGLDRLCYKNGPFVSSGHPAVLFSLSAMVTPIPPSNSQL
jgi:hypothetical protein